MYLSKVNVRTQLSASDLSLFLENRDGYGLHQLFWMLFSDGQSEVDRNKKREFLFREEVAGEQNQALRGRKLDPVYYLVSKEQPSADSSLFKVQTKVYKPKISAGERLAFTLRVNPVVTRAGKRHDIVMDAQHQWLKEQLLALNLDLAGSKGELKERLLDYANDKCLEKWRELIDHGIFSEQLEQKLSRSEILEWTIKSVIESAIVQWFERQGERLGFLVARNNGGKPVLESAAYCNNHLIGKREKASFSTLDLSGEIEVVTPIDFERMLFSGIGPAKAFGCGLMLIRRI